MFKEIKQRNHNPIYKRLISFFILTTFLTSSVIPPQVVQAQTLPILNLPTAGTMIAPTPGFTPALIKGVTIHPDNPLYLDFIVDTGDQTLQDEELRVEADKLVKYFLASLTVPEEDLWVNLSPYEKNRIIPEGFGRTDMGRDLLAQDYILKQLTASLMYPEDNLGRKFWDRVNEKMMKNGLKPFSTDQTETFNKIWIVPESAKIYEHTTTAEGEFSAFVINSRLKVMLEEDLIAREHAMDSTADTGRYQSKSSDHTISQEAIREILLPEIEKEVNEGENFANLRQIYNSMILAAWYKQNLKQSLLGQVYVDQNKTKGINQDDPAANQSIYNQYLEAFKTGVYDYIREDYDPVTQEIVPRKYVSGGFSASNDNAQIMDRVETFRDEEVFDLNPADFAELAQAMDRSTIQVGVGLYENADEDQLAKATSGIDNSQLTPDREVKSIILQILSERARSKNEQLSITEGDLTPESELSKLGATQADKIAIMQQLNKSRSNGGLNLHIPQHIAANWMTIADIQKTVMEQVQIIQDEYGPLFDTSDASDAGQLTDVTETESYILASSANSVHKSFLSFAHAVENSDLQGNGVDLFLSKFKLTLESSGSIFLDSLEKRVRDEDRKSLPNVLSLLKNTIQNTSDFFGDPNFQHKLKVRKEGEYNTFYFETPEEVFEFAQDPDNEDSSSWRINVYPKDSMPYLSEIDPAFNELITDQWRRLSIDTILNLIANLDQNGSKTILLPLTPDSSATVSNKEHILDRILEYADLFITRVITNSEDGEPIHEIDTNLKSPSEISSNLKRLLIHLLYVETINGLDRFPSSVVNFLYGILKKNKDIEEFNRHRSSGGLGKGAVLYRTNSLPLDEIEHYLSILSLALRYSDGNEDFETFHSYGEWKNHEFGISGSSNEFGIRYSGKWKSLNLRNTSQRLDAFVEQAVTDLLVDILILLNPGSQTDQSISEEKRLEIKKYLENTSTENGPDSELIAASSSAETIDSAQISIQAQSQDSISFFEGSIKGYLTSFRAIFTISRRKDNNTFEINGKTFDDDTTLNIGNNIIISRKGNSFTFRNNNTDKHLKINFEESKLPKTTPIKKSGQKFLSRFSGIPLVQSNFSSYGVSHLGQAMYNLTKLKERLENPVARQDGIPENLLSSNASLDPRIRISITDTPSSNLTPEHLSQIEIFLDGNQLPADADTRRYLIVPGKKLGEENRYVVLLIDGQAYKVDNEGRMTNAPKLLYEIIDISDAGQLTDVTETESYILASSAMTRLNAIQKNNTNSQIRGTGIEKFSAAFEVSSSVQPQKSWSVIEKSSGEIIFSLTNRDQDKLPPEIFVKNGYRVLWGPENKEGKRTLYFVTPDDVYEIILVQRSYGTQNINNGDNIWEVNLLNPSKFFSKPAPQIHSEVSTDSAEMIENDPYTIDRLNQDNVRPYAINIIQDLISTIEENTNSANNVTTYNFEPQGLIADTNKEVLRLLEEEMNKIKGFTVLHHHSVDGRRAFVSFSVNVSARDNLLYALKRILVNLYFFMYRNDIYSSGNDVEIETVNTLHSMLAKRNSNNSRYKWRRSKNGLGKAVILFSDSYLTGSENDFYLEIMNRIVDFSGNSDFEAQETTSTDLVGGAELDNFGIGYRGKAKSLAPGNTHDKVVEFTQNAILNLLLKIYRKYANGIEELEKRDAVFVEDGAAQQYAEGSVNAEWYQINLAHDINRILNKLKLDGTETIVDDSAGTGAASLYLLRELRRRGKRIKKLVLTDVNFPQSVEYLKYAKSQIMGQYGDVVDEVEFYIKHPVKADAKGRPIFAPVSNIPDLSNVDAIFALNMIHLLSPDQIRQTLEGYKAVSKPNVLLSFGSGSIERDDRPEGSLHIDTMFGMVRERVFQLMHDPEQGFTDIGNFYDGLDENVRKKDDGLFHRVFPPAPNRDIITQALSDVGFSAPSFDMSATPAEKEDYRSFVLEPYISFVLSFLRDKPEWRTAIANAAYNQIFDEQLKKTGKAVFDIDYTNVFVEGIEGASDAAELIELNGQTFDSNDVARLLASIIPRLAIEYNAVILFNQMSTTPELNLRIINAVIKDLISLNPGTELFNFQLPAITNHDIVFRVLSDEEKESKRNKREEDQKSNNTTLIGLEINESSSKRLKKLKTQVKKYLLDVLQSINPSMASGFQPVDAAELISFTGSIAKEKAEDTVVNLLSVIDQNPTVKINLRTVPTKREEGTEHLTLITRVNREALINRIKNSKENSIGLKALFNYQIDDQTVNEILSQLSQIFETAGLERSPDSALTASEHNVDNAQIVPLNGRIDKNKIESTTEKLENLSKRFENLQLWLRTQDGNEISFLDIGNSDPVVIRHNLRKAKENSLGVLVEPDGGNFTGETLLLAEREMIDILVQDGATQIEKESNSDSAAISDIKIKTIIQSLLQIERDFENSETLRQIGFFEDTLENLSIRLENEFENKLDLSLDMTFEDLMQLVNEGNTDAAEISTDVESQVKSILVSNFKFLNKPYGKLNPDDKLDNDLGLTLTQIELFYYFLTNTLNISFEHNIFLQWQTLQDVYQSVQDALDRKEHLKTAPLEELLTLSPNIESINALVAALFDAKRFEDNPEASNSIVVQLLRWKNTDPQIMRGPPVYQEALRPFLAAMQGTGNKVANLDELPSEQTVLTIHSFLKSMISLLNNSLIDNFGFSLLLRSGYRGAWRPDLSEGEVLIDFLKSQVKKQVYLAKDGEEKDIDLKTSADEVIRLLAEKNIYPRIDETTPSPRKSEHRTGESSNYQERVVGIIDSSNLPPSLKQLLSSMTNENLNPPPPKQKKEPRVRNRSLRKKSDKKRYVTKVSLIPSLSILREAIFLSRYNPEKNIVLISLNGKLVKKVDVSGESRVNHLARSLMNSLLEDHITPLKENDIIGLESSGNRINIVTNINPNTFAQSGDRAELANSEHVVTRLRDFNGIFSSMNNNAEQELIALGKMYDILHDAHRIATNQDEIGAGEAERILEEARILRRDGDENNKAYGDYSEHRRIISVNDPLTSSEELQSVDELVRDNTPTIIRKSGVNLTDDTIEDNEQFKLSINDRIRKELKSAVQYASHQDLDQFTRVSVDLLELIRAYQSILRQEYIIKESQALNEEFTRIRNDGQTPHQLMAITKALAKKIREAGKKGEDTTQFIDEVRKDPVIRIYKLIDIVAAEKGAAPILNEFALSVRYSPIVGSVELIVNYIPELYDELVHTIKWKRDFELEPDMTTLTNYSAILGYADELFPGTGSPVMSGKALLHRAFGGLLSDVLVVDTKALESTHKSAKRKGLHNKDELAAIEEAIVDFIITAAKKKNERDIHPHGTIMIEDISAPFAFALEDRMNEAGIPTMHDDQHGTAIVVVYNYLKELEKQGIDTTNKEALNKLKVVISGVGPSGTAVARLLHTAGIGNIVSLSSRGTLHQQMTEEELLGRHADSFRELASYNIENLVIEDVESMDANDPNHIKFMRRILGEGEGVQKADAFILLSKPGNYEGKGRELVEVMNPNAVVMALSNPNPEITDEELSEMVTDGTIAAAYIGAFGQAVPAANNSDAFPGFWVGFTKAIQDGIVPEKLTKRFLAGATLAAVKALVNFAKDPANDSRTFLDDTYNYMLTEVGGRAVYQYFLEEHIQSSNRLGTEPVKTEMNTHFDGLAERLKQAQLDLLHSLPQITQDVFTFDWNAESSDAASLEIISANPGEVVHLSNGYVVEPFLPRVIQGTRKLTYAQRLAALRAAKFNPFKLDSSDVYLDLLTDSGTGAQSTRQLASRALADETIAGNNGRKLLEEAVNDILGFDRLIPVHQGRAAEKILNPILLANGKIALGNRFFDTTTAQIEQVNGISPEEFAIEESLNTTKPYPFKGNVDTERLRARLKRKSDDAGYLLVTITDNSGAGQPVSIANMREMRDIADEYNLPLFADIARFHENAMFIKLREEGYQDKSIEEIVHEMMSFFDGVQMSSKKDAISPMGGFFAFRNDNNLIAQFENLSAALEGNSMSGEDMMGLAVGLYETRDENYLMNRLAQTQYLANRLEEEGIPFVTPPGGHGLFIDAMKFFDERIPAEQFPAQALANHMYLDGMIRPVEIGSLLAGRVPEGQDREGENKIADNELLRLTLPRRVYSLEQLEYIVKTLKRIHAYRDQIKGVEITKEPSVLRHFHAEFDWVDGQLYRDTNFTPLDINEDSNLVSDENPYPRRPFKNYVIKSIGLPPESDRTAQLKIQNGNLETIPSNQVFIDMWSNESNHALTQGQSAARHIGDEAYAGSDSFKRLTANLKHLFGNGQIFPAHNGVGAFSTLAKAALKPGQTVIGNGFTPESRAIIENLRGKITDLQTNKNGNNAWPGDINLNSLRLKLEEMNQNGTLGNIAFIHITMSIENMAGQSISFTNIEKTIALAKEFNIKVYADFSRIPQTLLDYKDSYRKFREKRSIKSLFAMLVRKFDGVYLSATKDLMMPTGGLLYVKDQSLSEVIQNILTLDIGFPSYGGVSGANIDMMAVSLEEALDETTIRFNRDQVQWFGRQLIKSGIPVESIGNFGVIIDAERFQNIRNSSDQTLSAAESAKSLAIELYEKYGIRAGKINEDGKLPLFLPRRIFTESHLQYVIESMQAILENPIPYKVNPDYVTTIDRAELNNYMREAIANFESDLSPSSVQALTQEADLMEVRDTDKISAILSDTNRFLTRNVLNAWNNRLERALHWSAQNKINVNRVQTDAAKIRERLETGEHVIDENNPNVLAVRAESQFKLKKHEVEKFSDLQLSKAYKLHTESLTSPQYFAYLQTLTDSFIPSAINQILTDDRVLTDWLLLWWRKGLIDVSKTHPHSFVKNQAIETIKLIEARLKSRDNVVEGIDIVTLKIRFSHMDQQRNSTRQQKEIRTHELEKYLREVESKLIASQGNISRGTQSPEPWAGREGASSAYAQIRRAVYQEGIDTWVASLRDRGVSDRQIRGALFERARRKVFDGQGIPMDFATIEDLVDSIVLDRAEISNNILIEVDHENARAVITLMNASGKNAITSAMVEEMIKQWEILEANDAVETIVITAENDPDGKKVFSAGMDLKEHQSMTLEQSLAGVARLNELFNMIAASEKETIAVINGIAVGGGLELALAADYRILRSQIEEDPNIPEGKIDRTKLQFIESRMGILPAAGGTQRAPRIIGLAAAKNLILLGRSINSERALNFGLVDIVIDSEADIESVLNSFRSKKSEIDDSRKIYLSKTQQKELTNQPFQYKTKKKNDGSVSIFVAPVTENGNQDALPNDIDALASDPTVRAIIFHADIQTYYRMLDVIDRLGKVYTKPIFAVIKQQEKLPFNAFSEATLAQAFDGQLSDQLSSSSSSEVHEEVENFLSSYIRALTKASPLSVALSKAVMHFGLKYGEEAGLQAEAAAYAIARRYDVASKKTDARGPFSWDEEAMEHAKTAVEKLQRELLKINAAETTDAAQIQNVGGINLNPSLMNLQIERDSAGIPLPLSEQPILQMYIEGFLPVIINVSPISNLPLLLGLNMDEKPVNSAQDDSHSHSELGAVEPKNRMKGRVEDLSYLKN